MHKFFVPAKFISAGKVIISDKAQAHHIYGVLHLEVSEKITVFDGQGNEYLCVIEELSKNKVTLSIKEKHIFKEPRKTKLTIACAIPKKSKFDDIIDKLTQLGVARIIPLETERVVVKLDKVKVVSRRQRWQKIALGAAQQSQRSDLMIIDTIKDMKQVLQDAVNYDLKIIPTLEGERTSLQKALRQSSCKNILVLIGPEGDFTPQELALAKKSGCVPVSLGDLVLRVETAAVAVASYIMLNADD